ncbi:hypothetical protein ACHAXA_004800 [Cyclostephanos tholiformis]|uniref:Uncharacterized protein n=1 Tax=Cyclostephanos tholiformis TaxID=382380 RepID=A0ABD3RWP5_9STRA
MKFSHISILIAHAAKSITVIESASIRSADEHQAAKDKVNDVDDEHRELWYADCATVAYWHPVYSVGWEAGYCDFSMGCNAPSYDSNLVCCQSAYLGQASGACLAAAGIAPTAPSASPPTSGAFSPSGSGQWYPDYTVDWAKGMCIDTVPAPPYGSRPIYSSQLQCCLAAYAGQTSNYCIQNLVNPPTASPTKAPTSKPTRSPTTPTPTRSPTTVTPTMSPTTSVPTSSPTTSTPTTSMPTGIPTVSPTKNPTSQPSTKSPTGTPTTREPTVTQYGNLWYPKYGLGVCSNQLPLPVNGAAPISTSQAACCQGNFNWIFAKCMGY